MRSSSSSSASDLPAKRIKTNPKGPVQRSPFTNFGSYMLEKNRKLKSQFEAEALNFPHIESEPSSSSDGKGIFHGVAIFVDGHTLPSSQELKGYMLRHGGRFENYFSRSRVTHIICNNLPDSKMRNLRSFSRGLPVLKPTWVVDCVAANKLLSWPPYQLVDYSSELCKQQKLSTFFGCKIISSLKNTELTSDSNDGIHREESEKSKDTPLLLQNGSLNLQMQGSITLELGIDNEAKFSTSLDKGTTVEASNFRSARLSIPTNHVDDASSREPSTSDVHCSTLTDPKFVENYFKHSRLHFIGTWRNRYRKRFCNGLKGNCKNAITGPCSSTIKSSIIHVDMDCFFVSVILRKYPDLLEKPVAICHSNNSRGTAEISSANYPARGYGIRAGMFVRDAKTFCPNLIVFPYDFAAYEEVADQFYCILHKHCNKVQALSCDEAFLDITECGNLDPESFAVMIRKEIVETTQCTASVGIAGNLLLARLATKIAKPNGQCFITPENVEFFIDDLPITMLPGIGHALGNKLGARKLYNCGQLRLVSKEALQKDFGVKVGDMLWNYCRGIDDRKVEVLKETKSVGAEVNWGIRFRNPMDYEHFLSNLSKEVSSRLLECGLVARTVNLKVKKRKKGAKEPAKFMGCGDCENKSRSITLPVATDDATLIQRIAMQIFASFHIDAKEVRGVGLQMSKLEAVDVTRQAHKHNMIESWFSVSARTGEETSRLDCRSNMAESLASSEENQQDLQHHGQLHENSQLCLDKAATCSDILHANLTNCPFYENASSTLPPVSHLDMSVIKHLPAEIISEMNAAYNGKLYDLMKKHDEDLKNNGNLLIIPLEVGGKAAKPEETRTFRELNHSKKAKASESTPHQVKLPAVSCSNLNVLHSKPTSCVDQLDWVPGFSSKGIQSMLSFSHDANFDNSTPAQGVLSNSAGDALWNLPNNVETKFVKSRMNLWSGSPPKWIEKFEVSNCLILNLIAQLYTKFGAECLLSPTLQMLISLYPVILGSDIEEPVEARLDLCELLLYYIDLKIDSNIEELYLCCRLLKRLTAMSDIFSIVYGIVLPALQASISETYGGTLQLSASGDD